VGDFLQLLLSSISDIWPLRIVRQWERAGYYVCGRYWKEIGPGCYPVIPWFTTVHEISVVPGIVETPRQDITLQDGSLLSFSCSAWARVVDFNKAVNGVDEYLETTREIIEAVCADKLASVPAERLEPEKRGRLLADLRRWVQEEASEFGIEITKLRFTSFVSKVRVHRFLLDANKLRENW